MAKFDPDIVAQVHSGINNKKKWDILFAKIAINKL